MKVVAYRIKLCKPFRRDCMKPMPLWRESRRAISKCRLEWGTTDFFYLDEGKMTMLLHIYPNSAARFRKLFLCQKPSVWKFSLILLNLFNFMYWNTVEVVNIHYRSTSFNLILLCNQHYHYLIGVFCLFFLFKHFLSPI